MNFPLFDPVNWLLVIGAIILILLALREVRCWYWKTNKIISLLEDIKRNTSHHNMYTALPTNDLTKNTSPTIKEVEDARVV